MAKKRPFALIFAREVKEHLRTIESKFHGIIRSSIEEHLSHEPDLETRNRKPLTRPISFGADWELRAGPQNCFRVFYTINLDSREVLVLAIGRKDGNRLFIGAEEYLE
jgi:hypothetical protein